MSFMYHHHQLMNDANGSVCVQPGTNKTDIDHVLVQLDTAAPVANWYAGLLVIDLLGLQPGCISSIRVELAGEPSLAMLTVKSPLEKE